MQNMLNLFPIPVSIHENFLSEDEAKKIYDICKSNTSKRHTSFLGDATSNHNDDINFLHHLSNTITNLDLRIQNFIDNYSKQIGLRSQKVANSWFNIQQKNSVLKPHMHANSILSGALYINVDDQSSKLYFDNPNQFIKYFEYNYQELTDYNFEFFYITPKIGDLVIFPSWLTHSSNGEQNNTENRTVISFNTELR